jgi:hypothetical protein
VYLDLLDEISDSMLTLFNLAFIQYFNSDH